MKNLFPISHEEALKVFGEVRRPNSVQKVYEYPRDLSYVFGGKTTNDNGSQFNLRVDEYTFPNGKILEREISRVVDQGYGIVESTWVLK